MSMTVYLMTPGQVAAERSAGVRKALPGDSTDWRTLSDVLLGVQPGPEVFLSYHNEDPRAGILGSAVVMGYLVLERPGRESADLGQALLAGWKARGSDFLLELEGSFCLYLHDEAENKSLLATDPMDSRPLWTGQGPYGTIISTDIREILKLLPRTPAFDRAYLWSFFQSAGTVANRSCFEGIQALGGGQVVESDRDGRQKRRAYWEPLFKPDPRRSLKDTAGELVDNLRRTVADLCHASRSPALLLSGGLDSRLMAGVCPEGVTGVTLCDRVNREIKIAARIARHCGMKHEIVFRDRQWYPSLMEEASLSQCALWNWYESHYAPLGASSRQFPHDVVTLGFGFDTYFKGLHWGWPKIWQGWPSGSFREEDFLDLIMGCPTLAKHGDQVLRPEVRELCKTEFKSAALEVIRSAGRITTQIPELWELFWTSDMIRVIQLPNLLCLRTFTSERNALCCKRMRDFSLTVPCAMRSNDNLVIEALRQVGKGLAWLPVADSWLPARFPERVHDASLACRAMISRLRGRLLAMTRSRDIASNSGWTRFDRLFAVNPTLRETMDSILSDDSALPGDVFDRATIARLWRENQDGVADHVHELVGLSTFGIFHRALALRGD